MFPKKLYRTFPCPFHFLCLVLFAFCSLTPCSRTALAQATTSLSGRVTDKSGAIIPGATVKLTLVATSALRENTSNGSGEFQFSQLAPGRYNLVISAPGFQPVERSGLDLLVSQPATVNVSLSIAGVTRTLT
jgi:hypothetical protein